MKFLIEVKNFGEAQCIKAGLADPEVRTLVVCAGILTRLPEHERARVINGLTRHYEQAQKDAGFPLSR